MDTKKLLLALLLILALAISACGGEEAEPVVEPEPAAATEEMEEAEPAAEETTTESDSAEEAEDAVACCMALTADCLACAEGVSVEEYCAANPETAGCEEEMEEVDLEAAFATFLGDMEAYNTIGIEALSEALAENPDLFLLDVRNPSELEENGYIEGAVNIPLVDLMDNLEYLPAFDEPIVSYCGSGWRCTIALAMLEALGWQDVKGLKGGSISGWIEAGYPVAQGVPEMEPLNAADPNPAMVALFDEALARMPEGFGGISAEQLNTELAENPDLILIDVRTAAEVEEKGNIDAENVIFIPLEELIARMDEWPADLDAPIVIYCGSGHRSTIAMAILWSYGYTDVRSLKGGFGDWAAAGYPTVGGTMTEEAAFDLDAAYQIFLDDMEAYNTVGLDEVNLALAEGEDIFILDVRNESELEESGYIEGAVLVPLRELMNELDELPSYDTPIVSYCGSGWRCTIALTMLEALGWEDVKGLKGGSFGGWVEAGYPVTEGVPDEVILAAVEPDPAGVEIFAAALEIMPEGYGGISADDLNAAIIENPDLIVIDVRTTAEVEEKGVIEAENWIHIPLEEFVARMDEWPADLDAPIAIYCGSGHRSTIAMTILWSYGYSDVSSLKGGFSGWVDAGYPIAEYVSADS